MTRTDWVRLYSMIYSVREHMKGKDPALCVQDATYFVDRMLKLTAKMEEEEKGATYSVTHTATVPLTPPESPLNGLTKPKKLSGKAKGKVLVKG